MPLDIKQKLDRSALKNFFKKNDMPTSGNFGDLIDGMLNQRDDGVAKLAGQPLSVQADGDLKKVLDFYKTFSDAKATWSLSLNPRTTQNDPGTARVGLSVSDGDGASKLFIDQASGNVGISTTSPAQRLHVAGGNAVIGSVFLGNVGHGSDYAGFSHSSAANVYGYGFLHHSSGQYALINKKSGGGWIGLRIDNADKMVLSDAGNVGIGTNAPRARLEVAGGAIMPSAGNGAGYGIQFPPDPGGGSDDLAWLRYYARDGEACTVELGIGNDGTDHIALMPSGYVGIGTNNPQLKLDVKGPIRLDSPGHAFKDPDSKMTNGGNLIIKGSAPQIDFVDTDNTDWSIHVNSNKMYFIRQPWNYQDLVLDGSGNVGIGTDQPQKKLDVKGDVQVSGAISCGGKIWIRTYHSNDKKYLGANPNNGDVYAGPNKDIWEAFTLEMACSREFKENIRALSGGEALATLAHLAPVKYDYRGQKAFRQNLGFIAEEMPDNLASESRQTLSPFEVTPVLTKVAQEQQRMLVSLQAMVEELSGKVRQLTAELQAKAS
jgi:hypothetical protein